ncbi:Uncharacterized protein DBV15_10238 [Temnothorax longispinosus]|uniref:Uncharacterized protein n=1 Tax=Temnothorax longispinosus TaxID=300112 RepID=A0A4S2JLY6_9HYME|nr:Uncharacterized protein DBV15_10238 [Temnothorax longispinosus]
MTYNIINGNAIATRKRKNAEESVRRTGMSAHGDNVTIGSSPYYFRHTTRESSARPQDDSFDDPCAYVMQKFRRQITNWSSWNACRQRSGACLYTLKIPVENNIIRATHKTSNLKSLERIEIIFEEMNNTCLAKERITTFKESSALIWECADCISLLTVNSLRRLTPSLASSSSVMSEHVVLIFIMTLC